MVVVVVVVDTGALFDVFVYYLCLLCTDPYMYNNVFK